MRSATNEAASFEGLTVARAVDPRLVGIAQSVMVPAELHPSLRIGLVTEAGIPSLDLVNTAEMTSVSLERGVTPEDVIRDIWDGVPSLRRRYRDTKVGGLVLLGDEDSPEREVGFRFADPVEEDLIQQRLDIQAILIERSQSPRRFQWKDSPVPAWVLGRVNVERINVRNLFRTIASMLPDTSPLDRARFLH